MQALNTAPGNPAVATATGTRPGAGAASQPLPEHPFVQVLSDQVGAPPQADARAAAAAPQSTPSAAVAAAGSTPAGLGLPPAGQDLPLPLPPVSTAPAPTPAASAPTPESLDDAVAALAPAGAPAPTLQPAGADAETAGPGGVPRALPRAIALALRAAPEQAGRAAHGGEPAGAPAEPFPAGGGPTSVPARAPAAAEAMVPVLNQVPTVTAAGAEASPLASVAAGESLLPAADPGRPAAAGAAPRPFLAPAEPGWGEALGQRIRWFAQHQQGRAEIQLDPPELGRIEVEVRVRGESAQVHFHSEHAAVRDAVEQALPRLREILAQAGFAELRLGVGGGGPEGQAAGGGGAGRAPSQDDASDGADPAAPTAPRPPLLGAGLIDDYA